MFDTEKCPFLPHETPFTAFLSRTLRESQHTRFEDQILSQVSLWGRTASCASLSLLLAMTQCFIAWSRVCLQWVSRVQKYLNIWLGCSRLMVWINVFQSFYFRSCHVIDLVWHEFPRHCIKVFVWKLISKCGLKLALHISRWWWWWCKIGEAGCGRGLGSSFVLGRTSTLTLSSHSGELPASHRRRHARYRPTSPQTHSHY